MRYEFAFDLLSIDNDAAVAAYDAAATPAASDAIAIDAFTAFARDAIDAHVSSCTVVNPNDHNAIVIAFDADDATRDAFIAFYDDDEILVAA